jgi:hypothetical protein
MYGETVYGCMTCCNPEVGGKLGDKNLGTDEESQVKFSFAQSSFFVVLVGATLLAHSSDPVATVSGRVLTEDGHPVSEASVYLAFSKRAAIGRPATVKTDEAGLLRSV